MNINFGPDGSSFAELQNVLNSELDMNFQHQSTTNEVQNQPIYPINIDYSLMKKPGDFAPGK